MLGHSGRVGEVAGRVLARADSNCMAELGAADDCSEHLIVQVPEVVVRVARFNWTERQTTIVEFTQSVSTVVPHDGADRRSKFRLVQVVHQEPCCVACRSFADLNVTEFEFTSDRLCAGRKRRGADSNGLHLVLRPQATHINRVVGPNGHLCACSSKCGGSFQRV